MMTVYMYFAYCLGSIALTIWVGRVLKKHGAIMLARSDEDRIAAALSDLLAMGFYLFHIGFAMLLLRYGSAAEDIPEAIETLSTKLGIILFALAGSHFIHFGVFSFLRRGRAEAGTSSYALLAEPAEEPRTEEPLAAEILG